MERRPKREPLPPPTALPRTLWWELVLFAVIAFGPATAFSLLALAIGDAGDTQVTLGDALFGTALELILAWGPVVALGMVLAHRREGWATIGLGRFQLGDGGIGVGLAVVSWLLVFMLAIVFSRFGTREVDFLPEELPLWFLLADAAFIAVTAGVTEEILVRGYAQTRLEQLRMPTALVLLLPTGVWGLLHAYQGLGAALTIFCLGMLYAVYFHLTRRLWPIVIAHVLFDATQLALLLLFRE